MMKPETDQASKRRTALLSAAVAFGIPAALSLHSGSVQAAQLNLESPQLVRVGPQRSFQTLQSAMASIVDASDSKRYVIILDPGVYDLSQSGGAVLMKSYVTIMGTDQQSSVILTSGLNNIQAASYARLERITILSSGHSQYRGAVELATANLADFQLVDAYIGLIGSGNAVLARNYVARAEIRNCTIVSTAVGIALRAGGIVYVHDTNIHLTGAGSDHIGILARAYCRIYVFGGKIGTGYGYPPVSNSNERVIGVLVEANGSGRVVLHGVWSICRNDGAPDGVAVNCLRLEGPGGWIRIFGCYLQAENPSLATTPETVSNPGFGRVEVYGSRLRTYGTGPVYGSMQIGCSTYSALNNNAVLGSDMNGLALLNAENSGFRLILPSLPTETAQFIFKKIDPTTNVVQIVGNGRLIDGQPSATLSTPFQVLSLRFAAGQYLIIP